MKSSVGWLLFEYQDRELVILSKPFKTKESAKKARLKYPDRVRRKIRRSIGVKRKLFTVPLEGTDSFFAASSHDGKTLCSYATFRERGDPPRIRTERITVFDVSKQKPILVTNLADLKGVHSRKIFRRGTLCGRFSFGYQFGR
jgi:hypothetical protein